MDADRVERSLRRLYPALSRALGPCEVSRLAHDLVASHPFSRGAQLNAALLLPDFLAVNLEDDARHGNWLRELARLEETLACAAKHGCEPPLLNFEHRVDEVHRELLLAATWQPPRPAAVVLAVERGPSGPRCVELTNSSPPPALPRRDLASSQDSSARH